MKRPSRIGFVLLKLLGHSAHAQNLKEILACRDDVHAVIAEVPSTESRWSRVAGKDVMAAIYLEALGSTVCNRSRVDGMFFHTVDAALLCAPIMRRIPSVLSLDATPLQYRNLSGYHKRCERTHTFIERAKIALLKRSDLKRRLFGSAFRHARHTVTWSEWARRSVIDDYEVAPDKVTCIPPGVDLKRFRSTGKPSHGHVQILFVGGDFARKGGPFLLRWARETTCKNWVIHIVTQSEVADTPGVVVHHHLEPNSERLIALYRSCDIFALPTQAECFGICLIEAMAAGLAVVSTDVSAIPEIVDNGVTGLLARPNEYETFASNLDLLISKPDFRKQLGEAGRTRACVKFSAEDVYNKLIDLVQFAVAGKESSSLLGINCRDS